TRTIPRAGHARWVGSDKTQQPDAEDAKVSQRAQKRQKPFKVFFASFAKPLRPLRPVVRIPAFTMTPSLVLLPGLACNALVWRAQLDALGEWQPRVADVASGADSIPAMAALVVREHAGPLVRWGASM